MKQIYEFNGYQQWVNNKNLWLMAIMNGTRDIGYEELSITRISNVRYKRFIV